MGEGQFAHITVVHLDSISYPRGLGVHQGCRSTVLPLVYLRPKINAHGTTTRQAFSGANEQESMSAANVEHSFMPLQSEFVEKAISLPQFSDSAAPHDRQ